MPKQIKADLDQVVEAVVVEIEKFSSGLFDVNGDGFMYPIQNDYTKQKLRTALEQFVVEEEDTASLRTELENERMKHAACGVIAKCNTPESLAKNREMKPEYLSASVQDCIDMAEREIQLRTELERVRGLLERASWLVGNPATNISSSTDLACENWQRDYQQTKGGSNG